LFFCLFSKLITCLRCEAKRDGESKNIALKELIYDMAEKSITQEELEKLRSYSSTHEELTKQLYAAACKIYPSECSKIVACRVGKPL